MYTFCTIAYSTAKNSDIQSCTEIAYIVHHTEAYMFCTTTYNCCTKPHFVTSNSVNHTYRFIHMPYTVQITYVNVQFMYDSSCFRC